jgi:hypothetical protein
MVGGAAHLARGGPDHGAGDDGDEHRGDAHRERDAAAVEHAREEILAQVVGAERVRPRGALQLGFEVDLVDGNAVDERADQHRDHHDQEHHHSHGGEPVLAEAPPRLAPERPHLGRADERDRPPDRLGRHAVRGGSHAYRYEMRGSSQP